MPSVVPQRAMTALQPPLDRRDDSWSDHSYNGSMRYRVDELAATADVSVDTIRFYQGRGLLPPPTREGRVAWYGADHVALLARIRRLQAQGLNLTTIKRLLDGELDAADEALATAVSRSVGDVADAGPLLTAEELAARTGIPSPLIDAVVREGLLVPHRRGGATGFTEADVEIARAGLRLLEHGLPLPDVLALARRHHDAVRAVAEEAVALFDAHVRQPLRADGADDAEAAARLVDAFHALLPATEALITHHFRRVLLAVAQEHIDHVGGDAERRAIAADIEATTAGGSR